MDRKGELLRSMALAGICVLVSALAVGMLEAWRTGTSAALMAVWLVPFILLLMALLHVLVLGPLHAQLGEARRQAERARGAHDAITGLPDRRQLDDAWTRELARADRRGETLGIGLLRIEGGIDGQGEAQLWEFGYLLVLALRAGDGAFRIGEREILLMLPGMPGNVLRRRLAQIARAATPRGPDDAQRRLAISFGAALYPRDGRLSDELLAAARTVTREPPCWPVSRSAPPGARPGD